MSERIDAPTPAAIARAAERLREGLLVAFPTETVYGLGADARNPEAVRGIFSAKGRPAACPCPSPRIEFRRHRPRGPGQRRPARAVASGRAQTHRRLRRWHRCAV